MSAETVGAVIDIMQTVAIVALALMILAMRLHDR